MGQNTSREVTNASSQQLQKAQKEAKVKGPPPQPLPVSPKELQRPTSPLPPLPSSSANEGLQQPAPTSNKTKEDLNKATEIVKESKEDTLQKSTNHKAETKDINKKPHMFKNIIMEAEKTAMDYSDEQLREGIYLNNRTKKYWVDAKGNNCFMLFAKALKITWIEDNQFWCWTTIKENNSPDIEVAKLIDVCWLEIHGRQDISYLNPGVTYEIFFNVMREDEGYGWSIPVNLRLKIPQGKPEIHTIKMDEIPENKWIDLKVGEFTADGKKTGEMEFSLYDYKGGLWKRGLLIKGATIKPKIL